MDRAQLVEARPVDFDVPLANDVENFTYVNYLQGLGSKNPFTFQRRGWSLPNGVAAHYEKVQPSLRPLNTQVARYHAPGGRESAFDMSGLLTQTGRVPPGYIDDIIQVNPKSFNFYGSLG
jgi:hypothetical protein